VILMLATGLLLSS